MTSPALGQRRTGVMVRRWLREACTEETLGLDLGIYITPRQVLRRTKGSQREVLGSWRYLRPFQEVCEVESILIIKLKHIPN